MFKQNIFASLALTAALGASVLMTAPVAHAKSTFISTWNGLYPASNSLNNATPNGCQLCHATASGSGRNAYGADLDAAMGSLSLSNALISIEGDDSDSDPTGSSNIDEINADTQPGWTEGDNPSGVIGDLDPITPVADISVSPLSVEFSAVFVGNSATDMVTISNVGSGDLTVDDLALSGSSEFILFSSPATPFTVAASTSVDLIVEYAPVDEGLDNGILEIVSDSPGKELVAVALTGTGAPIPVIADGDLAPFDAPDGLINAADVLIAIQLALDQRTAGALQYAHGDINADGVINTADLLLIQQLVMQN